MSDKKRSAKRSGRNAFGRGRTLPAGPLRRTDESADRGASQTTAARRKQAGRVAEEVERVASTYRQRVFEIVRSIPAGRVMTYGQIATLLGEGYTARTVGFVMHTADDAVPWHRVINAQGSCSTTRVMLPPDKQQRMLEAEGIEFDARGRCVLARYLWHPEAREQQTRSKSSKNGEVPCGV